jgi:ArsR family transcriptional regulator
MKMEEPITEMVADYFQALTHPRRIEILELLKDGHEMCVCEIVRELKRDQSCISRHLIALKGAGVVEFRSQGVRSFYKVRNNEVYRILDLVKSILQKQVKEGQKILRAF